VTARRVQKRIEDALRMARRRYLAHLSVLLVVPSPVLGHVIVVHDETLLEKTAAEVAREMATTELRAEVQRDAIAAEALLDATEVQPIDVTVPTEELTKVEAPHAVIEVAVRHAKTEVRCARVTEVAARSDEKNAVLCDVREAHAVIAAEVPLDAIEAVVQYVVIEVAVLVEIAVEVRAVTPRTTVANESIRR
jgi:rhodanese-related sulfurtransferase